MLHDEIHQPQLLGFCRGQALARHQVVLGAIDAHQERPDHRATVTSADTHVDVGIGKYRFV